MLGPAPHQSQDGVDQDPNIEAPVVCFVRSTSCNADDFGLVPAPDTARVLPDMPPVLGAAAQTRKGAIAPNRDLDP